MTTITTRSGKGSPLTNNEVDANFTNLNDDKVEASGDSMTGNLSFGDNNKAIFGAGSDLQIYHDGNNSFITETGTGYLGIGTNGSKVIINKSPFENMAEFITDGAVNLYHNNSQKFATTSTGIDVTGNIALSSAGARRIDISNTSLADTGEMVSLQWDANADLTFQGRASDGTFKANWYRIEADASDGLADAHRFYTDSSVERMNITSTGIDVTGTVTADDITLSDTDTPTLTLTDTTNTVTNIVKANNSIGTVGTSTANDLYIQSNDTVRQRVRSNGDISFYNDSASSQAFYWDASESRLGLGTTSPSYDLSVVGSSAAIQIDNTAGSPDQTLMLFQADMGVNDRNFQIKSPTTDSASAPFRFTTGNSFAFEIDSNTSVLALAENGNVGISDEDPIDRLTVSRLGNTWTGVTPNATTAVLIHPGTTSTGSGSALTIAGNTDSSSILYFSSDTDNDVGMIQYAHNVDDMIFRVSGSERLRIKSSGNVGIGTSNNLNDLLTVGTDTDGFTADVTGAVTTMRLGSHATGSAAGRFDYDRASGKLTYKEGLYNSEGNALLTIDNNGKVGIGTTSPGEELHISASVPTIRLQDSDGTGQYSNLIHSNGTMFFYARNGSSYGTFNFVGDNGTSQDTFTQITENAIQQFNSSAWYIRNRVNGGSLNLGVETSAGSLYYPVEMNGTSDVLVFNNAEGEMSRFDTNGNLLVGTTSTNPHTTSNAAEGGTRMSQGGLLATGRNANPALHVNRITDDGLLAMWYRNGTNVGNISVTSTATTYNTSSDQRLKDNIVDAPSASDDIDAIQVRSFDWKADGSHQKYGMVAQELNTVAPEAVTEGDTEDDMMGVDYSKLVPMLVKEIQSLRARVAQLETN